MVVQQDLGARLVDQKIQFLMSAFGNDPLQPSYALRGELWNAQLCSRLWAGPAKESNPAMIFTPYWLFAP